jgi:hypothetical protein
MRDEKNILEEKIHIGIAPVERIRIEDDTNVRFKGIKKCCVDIRNEVMLLKITLGKVLQMITNIELEVNHHLKLANPCFKSKV